MGVARRIKYKYKWTTKYNNTNVYQYFTKKNFVRDLFIFKVFSRIFSTEQYILEDKLLQLNIENKVFLWQQKKTVQVLFTRLNSMFLKLGWQLLLITMRGVLSSFKSMQKLNVKCLWLRKVKINFVLDYLLLVLFFIKQQSKVCVLNFFYFVTLLKTLNFFFKKESTLTFNLWSKVARLKGVYSEYFKINRQASETSVQRLDLDQKKPFLSRTVSARLRTLQQQFPKYKKRINPFFFKFKHFVGNFIKVKKSFKVENFKRKKSLKVENFRRKKYLKLKYKKNFQISQNKFRFKPKSKFKFDRLNLNFDLTKLNLKILTPKEILRLCAKQRTLKNLFLNKLNYKKVSVFKRLRLNIRGLNIKNITINSLIYLKAALNKNSFHSIKFRYINLKKKPLKIFKKKSKKKFGLLLRKTFKKKRIKLKKFIRSLISRNKLKKKRKIKSFNKFNNKLKKKFSFFLSPLDILRENKVNNAILSRNFLDIKEKKKKKVHVNFFWGLKFLKNMKKTFSKVFNMNKNFIKFKVKRNIGFLKKPIRKLLQKLNARYSILSFNKYEDSSFMFSLLPALLLPKEISSRRLPLNFTVWQHLLFFYQQELGLEKTYPFFNMKLKTPKNVAFFYFPQISNIVGLRRPMRKFYLLEEPLLKFYKVSNFFREKKEKWCMSYFRFQSLYKNTYKQILTSFDVNFYKEEARIFSIFLCKIIKFLVFCPFVKAHSKVLQTKIFWRILSCLLSKKIRDFLFINLKIKGQPVNNLSQARFFSDSFYNNKFKLPVKIFEYFNQKRSGLFVRIFGRLFKKYGTFRDILSKIPFRLDIQLPNKKFRRKTEKYERFQNLKIIRRYYGNLTRKQLSKYRKISLVKNKGTAFYNSILLLESRIDFFATKCNYFTPIFDARNFVLKGFLIVNGKQQTNINFRVDFGDLVSIISSFILNYRFYFTSKYIHNLHGEGGQILLSKIYPKYLYLASIAILCGYMPWMFCISLITENFFFDKVISENIGRFYYITV